MKKIVFLMMLFGGTTLVAQTKNFIDQPYIETRAVVDTLVVPDEIYMGITLTEKDTKGKISVEKLENIMAEELTKLGIDIKKQLFLSDSDSNFKKYFLKRQDILKDKNFSLLVHDALMVGKVLQALEKVGISNITIEKTAYSQKEALAISLRSKAILKAKNQASALATPIGQQVGKALHISDETSFNTPVFAYRNEIKVGYAKSADMEEPIAIEFSKIEVKSIVSVKFQLN